jgi:hypothetical protein
LDGTTKVIAGDSSCFVNCWNGTGDATIPQGKPNGALWRQVTYSALTDIKNSSIALGDINPAIDSNCIPDAVVGAVHPQALWSFSGDEWHNYAFDSPPYNLSSGWEIPLCDPTVNVQCSPVIGDLDDDGINDVAVGDTDGGLWIHLSSDTQYWRRYPVADADPYNWRAIRSSPAIATIDTEKCLVFGCDNGRVYAIKPDGTAMPGWEGGILLRPAETTPFSVRSSPVIGMVVAGSNEPQIVVGCIDGNVYALWKDGVNHQGGPVARMWTCTQDDTKSVLSTPTLCSLDGTHLGLVVGSTDGIYRIHFGDIEYDPDNWNLWQWRTFHYDAARTGCNTSSSATKVSASVIGKVRTSTGVGIAGVQVYIKDLTTNQNPVVHNRSGETRPTYLNTAGNATANDEINEGGYVINQLIPGRSYLLTFKRTGYTDRTYQLNNASTDINLVPDVVY